MEKLSVIIDYSKESDSSIDNFADLVYKSLNPNLNFTWKADVMTTFKSDTETYRTKLQLAKSGNSADIAAKNAARKELLNDIHDIAMEVNLQADGDEVKLKSSGLVMAKVKAKKGPLEKPRNLKVKTGANSGDFLCSVEANADATMYNFYTAPEPAPAAIEEWRLTPSTTHSKNITGFKPGTQYAVKCAYQGTDPN